MIFYVDVNARERGAIGIFTPRRVKVEAPTREAAALEAGSQANADGYETCGYDRIWTEEEYARASAEARRLRQ